MSRLRYAGLTGSLGTGGLSDSATTHTFPAALTYANGVAVPTLTGLDYFLLTILNSGRVLSEVVKVTAYDSGTKVATLVRGQEGTTAIAHVAGDAVTQYAYPSDLGMLSGSSPLIPGTYYTDPQANGSTSTSTSVGAMEFHPLPCPFGGAIDQIIANCASANASGQIRLGLYRSNALGLPGALVVDAGVVTAGATGSRAATITPVALDPGLYWMACLGENASGTWTAWQSGSFGAPLGTSTAFGSAITRLAASGVATGAMPDPAPTATPQASATGGLKLCVRAA